MPTLSELTIGGKPELDTPYFGIEVEAERLPDDEYERLVEGESPIHELLCASEFRRRWRMVRDGSLRHNGVEFVSGRIAKGAVEATAAMIPPLFAEHLVRTNPRAGVHVHCNAQYWTPEDLFQFLQTYIVMEPLYFQLAGIERAHNIYCVPLYSTRNEMHRWQDLSRAWQNKDARRFRAVLSGTCKYSALFIGPLLSYGSVEFRHAPTWDTPEPFMQWIRFILQVSDIRLNVQNTESMYTLPDLLAEFPFDWDKYFTEVEERGLYLRAQSLEPCTYKVSQWGAPAGLCFDATVPRTKPGRRPRPANLSINLFGESEYEEEEEEYEEEPVPVEMAPPPVPPPMTDDEYEAMLNRASETLRNIRARHPGELFATQILDDQVFIRRR